jgi:ATP-binding cassette subfamily F protein 3
VGLLIALDGKGGSQVIHGNYDTYEMMRAQQAAVAKEKEAAQARKEKVASRSAAAPVKEKKKRKFPYRKVADLEADIAARETELAEVEERMASPELYRDAEKVKQTTARFEELKSEIARLYEHWEEAVELGG